MLQFAENWLWIVAEKYLFCKYTMVLCSIFAGNEEKLLLLGKKANTKII